MNIEKTIKKLLFFRLKLLTLHLEKNKIKYIIFNYEK